ncbi:hypothetical protein CYMTET_28049 [Cymbomonas tetramitiformis]|uniref:Uncharacterized protein n=1 Tax=Cymbomonas tetramitiformis TaxID=36881 RepID=A0AAE0FNN9_9CHLO|nr:hypothetical protein CYMTET_28049 [Cymbomonas tetramitiformis]
MTSRNDHLIVWTSSVTKAKLRQLRQHLRVSARMRAVSWDKQRQQVLDWWVISPLPDLQLLPEDVRPQTEVLLGADLLAVDSSGARSVGLWPALSGPWAERKSEEFDKFAQVEAWVSALLNLTAPVIGASAVISAGGMSAGVAGASAGGAASSGPAGAAGSGGGVLTGTAGAPGAPGIWTVAAAGSAPVTAVSRAFAGAGGPGAGVLSGTAGATTGVPLLGGGVTPPEAELLARALRDSVATPEGWDVTRC